MKIWLLTDTHLGHEVLKEYCGRPEGFSEKILNNLKIIQPGDWLIHLGDFCIRRDDHWHEEFFKRLPGVKTTLIRGNHDRKSSHWYLEHGWGSVCESMTVKHEDKVILLSHKPMSASESFYHVNIHGHFHNSDHRRHEPELVAIKNDKQRLFTLENEGYQAKPITYFLK